MEPIAMSADRLIVLSCCLLLISCASINRFSERQLDRMLEEESPAFRSAFTGFALYDPASDEILYSHRGKRYFTPASNTKILTLYTALQAMGDSIPLLQYSIKNNQLTLIGTACPAFMHPDLPQDTIFMNFLQNRHAPVSVYFPPFYDEKYGPGWAWDDNNRRFQTQRSPFPIYGNSVRFKLDTNERSLRTYPEYFQIATQKVKEPQDHSFIRKRRKGNVYEYSIGREGDVKELESELPFQDSEQVFTTLLSGFTRHEVRIAYNRPDDIQTVYYPYPDSLYAYFMHRSDNFTAEHLLLQSALVWTDSLRSYNAINRMKKGAFSQLPQEAIWVDGSGISRYNMLSPLSIVSVLELIYDQYREDEWKCWFPAGGRDGTIAHHYGGESPWIYAKTGTMRNNHCLSGFLITKRGKVLLFSFMNNHFTGSSQRYKESMERVLRYIRDTYK